MGKAGALLGATTVRGRSTPGYAGRKVRFPPVRLWGLRHVLPGRNNRYPEQRDFRSDVQNGNRSNVSCPNVGCRQFSLCGYLNRKAGSWSQGKRLHRFLRDEGRASLGRCPVSVYLPATVWHLRKTGCRLLQQAIWIGQIWPAHIVLWHFSLL